MSLSAKLIALTLTLIVLSTQPVLAEDVLVSSPSQVQVQEAMLSQLPAPPQDFTWQLYKNVVFLKPERWHEQEIATSVAGIPFTTYAASPEVFSKTKQFEMGFTIQLISGSQRIKGIEAKKMVLLFLKSTLDTHKREEVLMLEQSNQGDFERTIFRYRDAPQGMKPIIVHKFFLANNVTDNVNIFTFESPLESWSDNWTKYGTPIISKLNILPNVPSE